VQVTVMQMCVAVANPGRCRSRYGLRQTR